MQKNIAAFYIFTLFIISCSEVNEGFSGEWEGTIEQLNTISLPIDVSVTANIVQSSHLNYQISLTVGSTLYEFNSQENMDELIYKDQPIIN